MSENYDIVELLEELARMDCREDSEVENTLEEFHNCLEL